jgi:hypothetical protein
MKILQSEYTGLGGLNIAIVGFFPLLSAFPVSWAVGVFNYTFDACSCFACIVACELACDANHP